jgi:hypothetical protein
MEVNASSAETQWGQRELFRLGDARAGAVPGNT